MDILPYLFYKLILVRIEITNGEISLKKMGTVRFVKGRALIREMKDFEIEQLSKYKNSLVILWVTGDQVVTKEFDELDQNMKRMINNPELICSMESIDDQIKRVSFLRRENLVTILQVIERNKLPIVDTWICDDKIEFDVREKLEESYKSGFKSTALMKSANAKGILINLLFQRIFLPVLLFFFVLLLGNYFLNAHYTEEYQKIQSVILRNNKNQSDAPNGKKKSQVVASYEQIPQQQSVALLADRIASYLPNNVFLTSMTLFPPIKNVNVKPGKMIQIEYEKIRLKGAVDIPGSVTLLAQFIEADNLLGKVKVVSLNKQKNSDFFDFELEIKL